MQDQACTDMKKSTSSTLTSLDTYYANLRDEKLKQKLISVIEKYY